MTSIIKHSIRLLSIACLCFLMLCGGCAGKASAERGESAVWSEAAPVDATFIVEGVKRTALIFPNSAPAPAEGAPLVFVFHGHGGNAQLSARRFQIHTLWPEAVVAYLQGLTGVEGITDPEGRKTGWQKERGQLGDRDVKFVDSALESLRKQYRIDSSRIYALGHSNGARFVNVLWNMRGKEFAAFCSASAQGGRLLLDVIPRSIFMIAGEKDPLVPFEGQVKSVELARKVLHTDSSKAITRGYARLEPGVDGTELVAYLHPGGHEFPQPALSLTVEFFKRHTLNKH